MILDQVKTDVAAQLNDQAQLGGNIVTVSDIPETGPANRGLWFQIPNVTAVFADLNRSTQLSAAQNRRLSTVALNYFTRAMSVAFYHFEARYVEVQGDAVFGLFSGKGSMFRAAACAITMRTLVEGEVAQRIRKDASSNWNLTAGIGIDQGTVLVRRLGLKSTGQNEVWTDAPVSVAAKLSSLADANLVVVSDRVFNRYKLFSNLRRQALLKSCGCKPGRQGAGLSAPAGQTTDLWRRGSTPQNLELDFQHIYQRSDKWCDRHGSEFCEALVTGKIPGSR